MTMKKRFALIAGILAIGSVVPAVPAQAHNITCSWEKGYGTPIRNSGGGSQGAVRVNCTSMLDDANTAAQLQQDNLGWEDWGTETVSHDTGPTIVVVDTAPYPQIRRNFRTMGTHFGQHGNIWSLPTYYSPTRYLG